MKKVFCILISLVLLAVISGCSGGDSGSTTTVVTGSSSQSQSASSSSGESSSTSSSPGKSIKPEQLISSEEAAQLIGEAVKAGVKDDYSAFGLDICFYAAANAESKNYLQIAVIQQASESESQGGESSQPSESSSASASASASPSSSASASGGQSEPATPKSLYDGFKKIFSDPNAAVTGRLGDDNFLAAQSISILSGDYCIFIAVGSFSPEAGQAILTQASEMVMANLQRILGE